MHFRDLKYLEKIVDAGIKKVLINFAKLWSSRFYIYIHFNLSSCYATAPPLIDPRKGFPPVLYNLTLPLPLPIQDKNIVPSYHASKQTLLLLFLYVTEVTWLACGNRVNECETES